MLKRSHSASLFLLCGAVLVGGCACEELPPDNPLGARITIASNAGSVVAADGAANLTLSVRSFNSDGDPDNTTLDVTATGGQFEAINGVGEVTADGLTFTATPEAGLVNVRFFCSPQTPEQVVVTATNGTVSGTFNINCIDPPGDIILDIDTGPCASLTASPTSNCPLTATLVLRGLDGSITPQPDVRLLFNVEEAVPTTPGDPSDTSVLTVLVNGVGQNQVTNTTDVDGNATIFVQGKDFDLLQTLVIRVSGTAANGTQVEQTVSVESEEFNNLAQLLLPETVSVATGETATISIAAINEQGQVAAGDTVTVTVNADTLASLDNGTDTGATVDVLLAADGTGSVDFIAPPVLVITDISLAVSYSPTNQPITDIVVVRVFPEGALIVNANAAPRDIASDDNETSTVTVTVERLVGGQLELVNGVDVIFGVAAADLERIGIGTRAGDPAAPGELSPQVTVLTDVDGEASAIVSSSNGRVRGQTTLEILVVDVVNGEQAETTVAIEVDRDPILQSIVFLDATPNVIGVRGSAYPSSSLVRFQIFDDLNQPIGNAAVSFDVNATADPEASVVGAALTNGEGIASTVLAAGTQAGPISVVATANFNGQQLTAESLPVVVTGGLPSFDNTYIDCTSSQSIGEGRFTTDCTATLVDRFSNRVPAGLGVHFRAEGGNITPTILTNDEGRAAALFEANSLVSSVVSYASAGGDSWSYGVIVPTTAGELTDGGAFTAAPCFDGSGLTRCNALAMCFVDENAPYCVLPLDTSAIGDGCWEHTNGFALTRDIQDIGPELISAFATLTGQNLADAQTELEAFNTNDINGVNYFVDDNPNAISVHERVEVIVNTYLNNRHRCGMATSCTAGQPGGLNFINFDGCPIQRGCLDFNPATECASDGVRTIIAVARGEESFVDTNGNGEFDFTDVNGNGLHDRGEPTQEPFVDMPEPFVDANDSCLRDDLTGAPRLTVFDEIRHTDDYVDEDDSGDFGYLNPADPNGPRLEGNGQWDRDKQIFVKKDVIQLVGEARIDLGVPCPLVDANFTCPGGQVVSCRELGPKENVADCPGGFTLQDNESVTISFRVIDGNGNCFSPSFGGAITTGSDGPVEFEGDKDVVLSENACDFGGGAVNSEKPWCSTISPSSDAFTVTATADCDDGDPGANPAGIDFLNEDANSRRVSFNVNCP